MKPLLTITYKIFSFFKQVNILHDIASILLWESNLQRKLRDTQNVLG